MIGFLRGEVQWLDGENAVIVAAGVGYEVACTPNTLTDLTVGAQHELWIYTQVRDDAIQLYGFLNLLEKQMFLALIKVNGVGPRSALNILGASPMDQLIQLINEGDAKGLSKLPKVGKKTAEQIILTLKGKLVTVDEKQNLTPPSRVRQDVVSALVHLGFRLADVERVVEHLPDHTDLESGVRESLAALTS